MASPSTVGLVARITSWTSPSPSSASNGSMPISRRTDAVERRQVTHQHEIAAAIARGLLDGDDVRRRLDHAQQAAVAPRARADRAQLAFGEHAAAPAVAETLDRARHRRRRARARRRGRARAGETPCAAPTSARRPAGSAAPRSGARARADTASQSAVRTAASCPGGSCMPPMTPDIFCCVAVSTRCARR